MKHAGNDWPLELPIYMAVRLRDPNHAVMYPASFVWHNDGLDFGWASRVVEELFIHPLRRTRSAKHAALVDAAWYAVALLRAGLTGGALLELAAVPGALAAAVATVTPPCEHVPADGASVPSLGDPESSK